MAITVDLDSKSVAYKNERISFDLDDYTRWRLMEGLDDIGLTMRNLGDVEKFEEKRANFKPKTLPVLS
jgi:3-isopropylmalate/(R)-2-methylmalate dehydratase small subunit